MGKILTTLKHPLRNYNIEERAHKIISQSKPIPAPKREQDQMAIDRLIREYPQAYEESLKKHDQLDKHLKGVFVTSEIGSQIPEVNPNRPLPLNRKQVEQFEYGTKEPEKVTLGKITLRTALDVITKHQSDPKVYTAKKIADDYHLVEERVCDILKYFRVFEVYIPVQKKQPKAKFVGPSIPQSTSKKVSHKALPLDDKEKT